MNIEESLIEFKKMIERDRDILKYWKSDTFGHYEDAIKRLEKDVLISETLLTAYEKEKEKEKNIVTVPTASYCLQDKIHHLEKELYEEKEKNKKLIKQHAIEITDVDGNSIRIDLDGKIHNVYKVKEE